MSVMLTNDRGNQASATSVRSALPVVSHFPLGMLTAKDVSYLHAGNASGFAD